MKATEWTSPDVQHTQLIDIAKSFPSADGEHTQPIDFNALYSKEQRPTWAGGTYKSSIMKSRAYDYEIMNTRGNGRDYEISLPCELVGESAPDRA